MSDVNAVTNSTSAQYQALLESSRGGSSFFSKAGQALVTVGSAFPIVGGVLDVLGLKPNKSTTGSSSVLSSEDATLRFEQMLAIQAEIQAETALFTTKTNVIKARHEAHMAAIRTIR